MSNFAIFSGFCERFAVFRSQINNDDELKLAAFDEALGYLVTLRDYFATTPSHIPIYRLLLDVRGALVIFDLPELDIYLEEVVCQKIKEIKEDLTARVRQLIEVEVGRVYAHPAYPKREEVLIAFLQEKVLQLGYNRSLLYNHLNRLKYKYSVENRESIDLDSFQKVINAFEPQRFPWGRYEIQLSVTHQYLAFRESQSPPYSARSSVRELAIAEERARVSRPVSRSAPDLYDRTQEGGEVLRVAFATFKL